MCLKDNGAARKKALFLCADCHFQMHAGLSVLKIFPTTARGKRCKSEKQTLKMKAANWSTVRLRGGTS